MHQSLPARAPSSFANLVEVIEARAAEQPASLALTFLSDGEEETVTISIRELRDRARAIAAVLQEMGAQGERALLVHAPGLDYVAAFLGCLYAGVTAVPAYPPDPMRLQRTLPRLQAIVHDAKAAFALTAASTLAVADALFDQAPDLKALRWVATDDIDEGLQSRWQPPDLSSDDLAFLQYTSGSTNTPKGVELTHANLLHNLEHIRIVCPVGPDSVFVSWLPPYHDMGLIAFILGPLYTGVPGVLMSPVSFLERPLRWLQAISRYRGSIACAPNFGFDLCVRRIQPQQRALLDLTSLTFVGSGGEPIRADTIQRFTDAFAACGLRREAFHPLYGLAEATLFVTGARQAGVATVKRVFRSGLEQNRVVAASADGPGTATVMGCGRALPGDRVVIAAPATLAQCPAGQIGEVWVSSPSVARGYWNRPQESAETFSAYLADSGDGPFLRTGDLGFMEEGELFVTGRIKDLIIIRGANHYAEDIELSAQASNVALRRGCGAAFSVDVDDSERLVLVQEVDARQAVDWNGVIGDIRQAVTEAHQVAVDAVVLIPAGSIFKTSSGKIQRHACRAEYLKRRFEVVAQWSAAGARRAPNRKSVEALLVAELASELGREARDIDPNTAITRYGLDSLAAYSLAHRIETATGAHIEAGSILDGATIRRLASQIIDPARRDREAPAAASAAIAGKHPLSHGQEAMWFLHELEPEGSAYHLTQAARILGPVDAAALRSALQELVNRHPALRTTFPSRLGRPVQEIHEHMDAHLTEHEVSGCSDAQIDERLHEEAFRPFDLEKGPLLRAAVFKRSPDDGFFVLAAHHIVADIWSLAIIVRELGSFYTAARQQSVALLPPLRHHYVDYVAWQEARLSGTEGERLLAHWRNKLRDKPPLLDLPGDRARPPLQSFRGAAYTQKLERTLSMRLAAFAQAHDATLFTTLLAAFQVLLQRHSGQAEILVGSPTMGRTRQEWTDVVGYFANPVVLDVDLTADPSFEGLLSAVRRTVIEALANAEYPIALLVEKLHPLRDPSRSPLYQVLFALQNTAILGSPELAAFALGQPGVRMSAGDLHLESYPLRPRAAQLDLALVMAELDGELCASWQFNTDLFDTATMARLAQHFETLLAGIVADSTEPISTLPMLSATERQQLLVDWNQTHCVFDNPRCIHQLFEAQVQRTPAAVAVACAAETLTFAELDRRANQLAHYLHDLGVGPEVPVAICVERSLEMMVGLLGIMKAGGAYLPLDPELPAERIGFMLEDAEPPVILTQQRWNDVFADYPGAIVRLDADWPVITREPEDAVASGVISTNLAYILYTSGSTGRPKGVMITHGGVCNYLLWLQGTFGLEAADHVLQMATLAFDASVTECYWALIAGARVVLAAPGGQRDPAYLANIIGEAAISVIAITPSALRLLLDQPTDADLGCLRLVLCGGEELGAELKQRFFTRLQAQLFNLYGPTEGSVVATCWKCEPDAAVAPIPIGQPIANVRLRVLDANLELVPIGVPGELHIGGAGLARGYLSRPALTDERFIEDPFSREPRERLYKTGDLARYRPDGALEFLGRIDHQVKIRGYRIELGEIETILAEHMAVRECVAVAQADERGEQRLIAYVVPRWEEAPKSTELRAFLKSKLPEYMVPALFVTLPALPLNASGKLDRKALPEPGAQRPEHEALFVAPRSAEEFRLCELWGEVLAIELVGIHDDFFELGGDSLRAAQLAAKVGAKMQLEVSVKFILQHRNVAAAAAALSSLPALRQDSAAPVASRKPAVSGGGHLQIERRSLLSLFAAGKIEPVQAAALAYFPTALIEHGGMSRVEVIDEWCENLPLFSSVHDTSLGRIATVMLPRFADQLYNEKEALLGELVEALQLAGRLGARLVSLTGLLPSATNYGSDLLQACAGMQVPQVTTGHATTAATVALAIKKMLLVSDRDLTREHVAFLGLGSIGAATLAAMLQLLPHPAEILLCDLAARREHLCAMHDAIVQQYGYRGPVRILESGFKVDPALYEARLIVGATSVADVLDVDRLQAGSMIVDDSAPHCFNTQLAIERLSVHKDILFTEGGVLRAPQPFRQLRYVPRAVEGGRELSLLRAFELIDPHEITGCVLSSTLTSSVDGLTPTLGLVDGTSCVQHFRVLEKLGFDAGILRCEGMVLPEAHLQAFRSRFGGRTG